MTARERIAEMRETAKIHQKMTKRYSCECSDCRDVRRMNAARD